MINPDHFYQVNILINSIVVAQSQELSTSNLEKKPATAFLFFLKKIGFGKSLQVVEYPPPHLCYFYPLTPMAKARTPRSGKPKVAFSITENMYLLTALHSIKGKFGW
jgi:hypothetical protein